MTERGLKGTPLSPRRTLVLRLSSMLAFLAVWSLGSGLVALLKLFSPIFLPGPWVVLAAVTALAIDGSLWGHLGATLGRVAAGFAIGTALGLALGLPAGHFPGVRRLLEPIVEMLRPIPPLAVLPLFIVWIGIGEASKVGFITYATFFPMFLSTVHAVRQVDPLLLRAAASLGARRGQRFSRVILPAALPDIFTGIRLGVALSFFVIVISEFIGAEQGLGYLINDGRNFFLVPQMLGAAVLLGVLGFASSMLVGLLERRLVRWERPR
jgi:ABC-type nitrate/sulfonate/bicarbonate transport system permease component